MAWDELPPVQRLTLEWLDEQIETLKNRPLSPTPKIFVSPTVYEWILEQDPTLASAVEVL